MPAPHASRWTLSAPKIEHSVPQEWQQLTGSPTVTLQTLHLKMPNCRYRFKLPVLVISVLHQLCFRAPDVLVLADPEPASLPQQPLRVLHAM